MFQLPGVQLDDQLFVNDRLHFFPRRDSRDFTAQAIAIDCQPVGNGSDM